MVQSSTHLTIAELKRKLLSKPQLSRALGDMSLAQLEKVNLLVTDALLLKREAAQKAEREATVKRVKRLLKESNLSVEDLTSALADTEISTPITLPLPPLRPPLRPLSQPTMRTIPRRSKPRCPPKK